MIARVLVTLMLAAGPALSHELPGTHLHPHGDDWNGALAILLTALALGALLLRPGRSARRSKDEKRDPR